MDKENSAGFYSHYYVLDIGLTRKSFKKTRQRQGEQPEMNLMEKLLCEWCLYHIFYLLTDLKQKLILIFKNLFFYNIQN